MKFLWNVENLVAFFFGTGLVLGLVANFGVYQKATLSKIRRVLVSALGLWVLARCRLDLPRLGRTPILLTSIWVPIQRGLVAGIRLSDRARVGLDCAA